MLGIFICTDAHCPIITTLNLIEIHFSRFLPANARRSRAADNRQGAEAVSRIVEEKTIAEDFR